MCCDHNGKRWGVHSESFAFTVLRLISTIVECKLLLSIESILIPFSSWSSQIPWKGFNQLPAEGCGSVYFSLMWSVLNMQQVLWYSVLEKTCTSFSFYSECDSFKVDVRWFLIAKRHLISNPPSKLMQYNSAQESNDPILVIMIHNFTAGGRIPIDEWYAYPFFTFLRTGHFYYILDFNVQSPIKNDHQREQVNLCSTMERK